MPYQAFRTADGFAVAGVWADEGWPRFCRAIDRPDLANEERYQANIGRVRHREELEPILSAVFAQRTTSEWEARFRAEGVLFGPVHTFSEILEHPQVEGVGVIGTVNHATLGTIPQLGPVIGFSDTPGRMTIAPPVHGEHSREILSEAGYSPEEIEKLKARSVVKLADTPATQTRSATSN
jgi:crotonobetainyl-CoA:carnitine CoA-transferase CaiB-like acyl-CoA transferase